MNPPLAQYEIHDDRDFAGLRLHARTITERLGFEARDRAEIAAALTRLARETLRDAAGGIEFHLVGDPPVSMSIRAIAGPEDRADPEAWRALARDLPTGRPPVSSTVAAAIAEELLRLEATTSIDEWLRLDRELLDSLDELARRKLELGRLGVELDATNRGVVALHRELDDRAESLKKANETRSRFLSSASHELRTPLASIVGLARLLLARSDGELSEEQERQVTFILRAAHDLTGLVAGMFELARIDDGRESLLLEEVDLSEFVASLRAMFRPLLPQGSDVVAVFEDPAGLPTLRTDGAKLAQVLRNLLSNALKFTEEGEVRLKVAAIPGDSVAFIVSDTGIGIEAGHLERIFEELAQIEGPLQRQSRGTGMGLPMARRLAQLLGGRIDVESRPGAGSTFTLSVPIVPPPAGPEGGPAGSE